MKKTRFTETQIVNILKPADLGLKVAEIWRRNGINNATHYNWNPSEIPFKQLILKY